MLRRFTLSIQSYSNYSSMILFENFSVPNRKLMKTRRSAVFVIPNSIVGHELVFSHYTNKVVVGNYTYKPSKNQKGQRIGKERGNSNDNCNAT
jgi:hypothetical protein